jgi:hypothetical protein
VFPDTNVLASAFGTRGLCADVLRLVLAEHELVTGEIVIEELRGVLRRKFALPTHAVAEVETFLRGYYVEPRPRLLPYNERQGDAGFEEKTSRPRNRRSQRILGHGLGLQADLEAAWEPLTLVSSYNRAVHERPSPSTR